MIPDPSLSLDKGAVKGFNIKTARWFRKILNTVTKVHGISLTTPFEKLTPAQQGLLLYGDPIEVYQLRLRRNRTYAVQWEGIIPRMERLWRESDSEDTRLRLAKYFTDAPCQDCNGSRLRPESRAVRIDEIDIVKLSEMSIGDAFNTLQNLKIDGNTQIARIVEGDHRSVYLCVMSVSLILRSTVLPQPQRWRSPTDPSRQ